MINIDKLYDLMCDKGFQDPETGNLFFPAYIYTYEPDHEYEMRRQINLLIEKLKRPNHFLDTMVINLYHEIINFLKAESFSQQSIFSQILEMEKEDPQEATRWVQDEMNGAFYPYLKKKVAEHFSPKQDKRVFLIIHGIGSAYPYVRASEFLKRTESWIKDYKVILFYPGEYKNSNYSLFKIHNDDNLYRANHLNKIIGDT